MTASKNWTLNATAAAWKKFDGGVTGQSTTSTPSKFDSVSRRNSTAPGSIIECSPLSALHRVTNETSLNQMADTVDDEEQYANFAIGVIQ